MTAGQRPQAGRHDITAGQAGPTWICSLVPAVMLEMVQHASFLMLFLWLVVSRLSRQGSAPQLMMIWWRSGGWKVGEGMRTEG